MTNYEKVKSMSIDEMASFLKKISYSPCGEGQALDWSDEE